MSINHKGEKRPFGGFKSLEVKKAYNRKYYIQHRKEFLDYQKDYRRNNINKIKIAQKKYREDGLLVKKYGINGKQFKELCKKQNNACAICETPRRKLSRELHVDHDHSTGKVRGLLCNTCNRALGYFYDSIKNLKSAQRYLSKWHQT